MEKLYFQHDAEMCYPLNWHFEYMKDNGLKKMSVFKAIIDRDSNTFFCKKHNSCGEKNGTCKKNMFL